MQTAGFATTIAPRQDGSISIAGIERERERAIKRLTNSFILKLFSYRMTCDPGAAKKAPIAMWTILKRKNVSTTRYIFILEWVS